MLELRGYDDFVTAGHAVLKLLRDRMGFDLWMITRVVGDDWIVLQAEDHGYGVKEGSVFSWVDSFCSEMVKGNGPCIASHSNQVTSYRNAPINQQVKIGAYIGLPLIRKDGTLFGTLCGIHPTPVSEDLNRELPLLEVLIRLLSSCLDAELDVQQERRRADRAEMEAQTDALTGLYNRRGWNRLLAAEEHRCHSLGYPACVIVIDLDDLKQINDIYGHALGDQHLKRLAKVLMSVLRKDDVAARLGGDEFAILGIEMNGTAAFALVERLRLACTAAGVDISIGLALRHPAANLETAWQQADAEMYRQKRIKKNVLPAIENMSETL